jgi:hypothetical protein
MMVSPLSLDDTSEAAPNTNHDCLPRGPSYDITSPTFSLCVSSNLCRGGCVSDGALAILWENFSVTQPLLFESDTRRECVFFLASLSLSLSLSSL